MQKKFMRLAMEKAREGIRKGQTPFGACIVKDDKVIACEHNVVWKSTDITAHAEVHALRKACEKLKQIDLTGCDIYSTCEPCPMCFSALHWARVSRIFYGATIADAKSIGFNELRLSNRQIKSLGKSRIQIIGPFMRSECLRLFKGFNETGSKKVY
ncbi:MAG TPA: nucleoside deaminase [Verrucomicrobiae bacterium]|nr:nucleoside deaminase [Verrucomicrobiae bacterium]